MMMIKLLRVVLLAKLTDLLGEYVLKQRTESELLQSAAQQINEWQILALGSQRAARDIAIAFRDSRLYPEFEIDGDLDQLVEDLSNSVAQLEEHIAIS